MSAMTSLKAFIFIFITNMLTTDASYLGCFRDLCSTDCNTPTRVLDYSMTSSNDMTIDKCINYCLDFNSPTTSIQYAGLETERECHCGEAGADYNQLGQRNNEDCNPLDRPCAGDSTQACGADFAIAVYDLFQLECLVPSISNGLVHVISSGLTSTTVPVRMNLTVICSDGYILHGSSRLQCIVTTAAVTSWDYSIPTCQGSDILTSTATEVLSPTQVPNTPSPGSDILTSTATELLSPTQVPNTSSPGNTVALNQTRSDILTLPATELLSPTQVPNASSPRNTMALNQTVIIGSGAGGGVLLIIILILLVCLLKRKSEKKRESHHDLQPESVQVSPRPTSLLDRTSNVPAEENTYQETSLQISPNQRNRQIGTPGLDMQSVDHEEPDLSYAYASVSTNQPEVPDPTNEQHDDREWTPEESYEYATVTKNQQDQNEGTPNTPVVNGDAGHEPEPSYDYASVPIKLGKPHSLQAPEESYAYATVSNIRERKSLGGRGAKDEEEGWMDNTIYDMSEGKDGDKRNETEGWEENAVYISSDR